MKTEVRPAVAAVAVVGVIIAVAIAAIKPFVSGLKFRVSGRQRQVLYSARDFFAYFPGSTVHMGENRMTQVVLGENEGIESALRRFKRQVSKAGIFQDMKKKRHFETPLEKEKRKALAKHKQRKQRSHQR
ncbi:30S ribosomal protein S21 [Trichocoleus desertorum]